MAGVAPRAQRAAARKNAADLGSALANHYSPPPKTGGGQQHARPPYHPETLGQAVRRMFSQGFNGQQIAGQIRHWHPDWTPLEVSHAMEEAQGGANYVSPTHTVPAPRGPAPGYQNGMIGALDGVAPGFSKQDMADLHKHGARLKDALQTGLAQSVAYSAGVTHGHFDPSVAMHIHVRGGKVQLTGTPQQRVQAAGLLQLQGTGNILQKAGSDLLSIPAGMASIGVAPGDAVKGLAGYYSKNPLENLRQDPFMFGLSYVLPATGALGGAVGRAGAVGETLRSFSNPDLSLADRARLHGTTDLGDLSAGKKVRLAARAAVRTPVARPREFTIGDETISAPSSRNHAVNVVRKYTTDKLIAHALDNGLDIFGGRSKAGRMVRQNLRFRNSVRRAEVSRVDKVSKGMSAPQEHAAFVLGKGHTAESYARFAQRMHDAALERGDEGTAHFYDEQLHLTKIAAQYLKAGEEHPKVLKLASVIRDMISRRERWYGYTEHDINHSVGSHFYGIEHRGTPQDMHAELDRIYEEHGPAPASAREALDQEIAALSRAASNSGPEHRAELHAEISKLHGLNNDIELARHRIAETDQRIADLGSTHYRGRMTEHPDRLAATHRELLVQRSKLEDDLHTLEAHARMRDIHQAFTEKGAELRGHVMQSDAREQLIHSAVQHGVDPEEAAQVLDARALRWARETGRTTRDFYDEFLHGVHEGGHVPDEALLEVGPIHRFDVKREAQARGQYEKAGEPKYGNGTLRDEHGHVILGPITPPEWVARVEHAVPSRELRDDLARWYESFEPIFRAHFGKDADAIMRGFAVSQANQSPAGGITATLRVFDKVRQGIPVTEDEISTVAKGIEQAVKGQSLLEKGLGQKLSDFTDSLRELDTRTITGHSPEHGAPTAIDVHAARDLGYVDNKLVRRLEGRHGLKKGIDFNVDNPGGSPSGIAYERMLKQYGEITDYLNQIGFDGRHDWTPAQAQALGWSAIQRFHGVEPEDLQFAIDRNTYEIPYEVGNGMEGSRELPAQYSAALKVTKGEESIIRSIVETNGAYVRGFHYGPGGYEGDINAAGVARVIASPEQADRIAQTLADHFKQWEVWATRPGVTGARSRASLELGHTSFRTKAAVEKFWRAFREALPENLRDKAVGFTPIKYDENTFGMRIITSHPAFVTSKADDFIDRYHAALETAADKVGIDELGVRANNVEVRPHSGEDQTGSAPEAAAGLEGVGDRADAEGPGEALHQEVGGEVRGAYNPATREVSLGEHADAETFAHESLHAVRPSLDTAQMSSLERHYGVEGGEWTRAHEEQFVADMARAARGEDVPPIVQSVFNASLVAPPEAFHLPFELETKPSKAVGGSIGRSPGQHGYGPAQQEATHRFTGSILDTGGFRTKASHLARSQFSKAAHWRGMEDLHQMLWSLSKGTAEEAGKGRFGHDPIPIRDIRQVPASLKEEAYSVYPGNILVGEAPDDIATRLMEAWTAPPKHGEHVRWVNSDFVRPLEPKNAGAGWRFVNNINNAFRFGRYLNPGYAKWLPQNLTLTLTSQGPLIFRNAAKMMTELSKLDPSVYHQIADSVSFGSARAFESETVAGKVNSVQHKVSNFWAHFNDHVPRMLQFIHEAQRAGFKNARDWERLMTDPSLESTRDSVLQLANKEQIDYGAMTARERVYMKSLFAYWPWVRAASLWALRFPFEHPYQAAVLMEASREGKQHNDEFFAKHGGLVPPYLEGSYAAQGGPINLSAVNPWEQLGQDAEAISGLTQSRPELAGEALGSVSPVAKPVIEVLTGRDQNGNIPKSGVLADATDRMLRTFEPYSVYKTSTETQTGSVPKGPAAAIMKWLGNPQESGFDYDKAAKNALRDVNNETRARFMLEHDPNASSVPRSELQLVVRVAQIKDHTKSKSKDQIRALELADAAYQGTSLGSLNSLLTSNGIRPVSQGDLNAERARQRSIHP